MSEKFGKECFFFLRSGKSGLKNGKGAWEKFVESERVEVIGKVVCRIGNKFSNTEEMSSFVTGAGAA